MGFSATTFLADAQATDQLGADLASCVKPGDTILLDGQIGAGKSHLARAIIQSLMRRADVPVVDVPSPTYTLVQTYELPNMMVWHADLYRLADSSEAQELGLDDAFGVDIVLIEWPDRLDDAPQDALYIAFSNEGAGRRMQIKSNSNRWQSVLQKLGFSDA